MRPAPAAVLLGLLVVPVVEPHAQQFFTPGAEVDGQISVQVNATLNDGIDDYHPVDDLTLILYRGATDSMALRTDGAGVLRFVIAPGTYRLSTPQPVEWHGRSYRWNIPLVVAPRMGIVNLTVANAVVAGPTRATATRGASPSEPARAPTGATYARKDGGVGVLFGFLLTGGGQFYAGKHTKGAILLGLSLAEAVAAVSMVQRCDPYCTDGEIATAQALLLPVLFNWVYGMATAPGDVRQWNEEHAAIARVRPKVERRDGRTGLGLALAF